MKRNTWAGLVGILVLLALSCSGWQTASAKDVVRVAEGPFLSGAGVFIARDKGYFDKLGLDVKVQLYSDGVLALPAMISGELDIAVQGAAASFFNAVEKGAPLVIFLDRGNNRPGRALTATVVSQPMYDQGLHTFSDIAKLKGKKIGVSGVGSINQYAISMALVKAGLNPATDVQWVINVPQPDLMKMLGQNQLDAIGAAYNIATAAESNKFGHIIGTDDQSVPGGQVAVHAVSKNFIAQHRDALVRFTMAYLQAVKEFNDAALHPDAHPDVIDILAKNTSLGKPELVKAIAPHWSYMSEDGEPNIKSIMTMQDFWAGPYFHFVRKKLPEKQLFDLSIIKEARERLARERPFGP